MLYLFYQKRKKERNKNNTESDTFSPDVYDNVVSLSEENRWILSNRSQLGFIFLFMT